MTDKELELLESVSNDKSHDWIDSALRVIIDSDIADIPRIIIDRVKPKIKDFIFYDVLGSVVYGRKGPPKRAAIERKTSVSFDNPSYDTRGYDSYFEAKTDNSYKDVALSPGDFQFNKVFFKSRDEAVSAKRKLEDIINDKGVATLTEYCRVIGKRPEFTYNSVGWDSVSESKIIQDSESGKWRLILPPVKRIYK